MDLLTDFVALNAGAQAAIMLAVAGGVVAIARRCGLAVKPGWVSVLSAALTGAVLGYAAGGWSMALLGAVAGLGATGAHQLPRQVAKARAGGE